MLSHLTGVHRHIGRGHIRAFAHLDVGAVRDETTLRAFVLVFLCLLGGLLPIIRPASRTRLHRHVPHVPLRIVAVG